MGDQDQFPKGTTAYRKGPIPNAEAVTQRGDDFNLLVAREDVHGADPWVAELAPVEGRYNLLYWSKRS